MKIFCNKDKKTQLKYLVPKLNLTTRDKALKIALKNIKLLILNSSSESFKKNPITITLFLFGMKPLTLKLKKQITEIAKQIGQDRLKKM